MTKLWKTIDKNTGEGKTGAAFRMAVTVLCLAIAAVAAAVILGAGQALGFGNGELAKSVVLAGGWGGVAGYLAAILYELREVSRRR